MFRFVFKRSKLGVIRPPREKKPRKETPPRYEWPWFAPPANKRQAIRANTKGEARSRVKAVLGIPRGKRLPQSVVFGSRKLIA